MRETNELSLGLIDWIELTASDAEDIKRFYEELAGWKSDGVDMGGYEDYNMREPASGTTIAGICHARGVNSDLPAQWLIYIIVENVEESIETCKRLGGKVIVEPRNMGDYGRFCVIEDPAGAVAALLSRTQTKK